MSNTGEVFIVITRSKSGVITHMEVLDSEPRWNTQELGQTVFQANVNGGDSTLLY